MPKRKPLKYFTQKEIEEILFRESSDEDVDHVEAEEMYDSESDVDYIPKPGDDDSDSDGFEPSTSSHRRKKMRHRDSSRLTTRQIPTSGPFASRVTAHLTSPATPDVVLATPDAVPATPDVGHRGRGHRHVNDDMAYIVRLQNKSYRSTSGFQGSSRPQILAATRTAARCLLLHQDQHQKHQMLTPLRSVSHYFLRRKSSTKL